MGRMTRIGISLYQDMVKFTNVQDFRGDDGARSSVIIHNLVIKYLQLT